MHLNRTLRNIRQARQCVKSLDLRKLDSILELAASNGQRAREAVEAVGRAQNSLRGTPQNSLRGPTN